MERRFANEVLAATPQALPPAANAMDTLLCGVKELHAALDEMERRLAPVLTPEPPHPVGNDAKEVTSPKSPLVVEIETAGRRVSEAIKRIGDITHRAEV